MLAFGLRFGLALVYVFVLFGCAFLHVFIVGNLFFMCFYGFTGVLIFPKRWDIATDVAPTKRLPSCVNTSPAAHIAIVDLLSGSVERIRKSVQWCEIQRQVRGVIGK